MKSRPLLARVMIVDDHALVREGLALRISTQPDLKVCGEAASESEALALVAEIQPDLMTIDLSLKGSHGLDLIKQLRQRFPQIKILVLSGFQESLFAERALRAGALGYLNKQESNEKVIDAIRTVLAGKRFISAEVTKRLVDSALNEVQNEGSPVDRLTDRELEIFRLIGEGHTTGAIAQQLHLSTHTIDSHRENLKRKLGAKNAGELSRQAVQWILENS
jgi:DNA-binding NarL/FixJ family response regulator